MKQEKENKNIAYESLLIFLSCFAVQMKIERKRKRNNNAVENHKKKQLRIKCGCFIWSDVIF